MATKLPTVAIIGQTNVGKSSLFNRMTKRRDAIVAREEGTTRDSVTRKVVFQSHQFWLVDTAGLKDPEDDFEATIQDQIDEASEVADVILVVADTSVEPSHNDKSIAKKALKSKKPVILALNKADLSSALDTSEFRMLGIKEIIRTSAEHNRGVTDLLTAIVSHLPERQEKEADSVLRVALIGRPNVGKSHLFNTLAGKQQAVVANRAGTTRDVNRVSLKYHGKTIEILDTAGIRRQGKQQQGIEKFSVLRTMNAIDEADICFLLMDASEINVALDQRLAGLIDDAGKGLVIVVNKWDLIKEDSEMTHDSIAPKVAYNFEFVPWAPLIFTSATTGQNVTKLFDIAFDIQERRQQKTATHALNTLLQQATQKHPPAGLKNSHPKLRYIVQTDTTPPWFVIHGHNLRFVHWSYKRYLERLIREKYDYAGTPIKFSFIDEKQVKANADRIKEGKDPYIKAKKSKEIQKKQPRHKKNA